MAKTYEFAANPRYISQLEVVPGYTILSTHPMPNIFWRTMQYLMFGFKWSRYE